jgi:hypothetical protein
MDDYPISFHPLNLNHLLNFRGFPSISNQILPQSRQTHLPPHKKIGIPNPHPTKNQPRSRMNTGFIKKSCP